MTYTSWNLNLVRSAARYTVATALMVATPNKLYAQELKTSSPFQPEASRASDLSAPSGDSSRLQVSAASLVSNATATPLNLDIVRPSPSLSLNFSLTALEQRSARVPVQRNRTVVLLDASQDPRDANFQTKRNASSIAQIAQSTSEPQRAESDTASSEFPNRLYIGPDFFYRDYSEEEITPGFKSDEFGTLFGLQATYDYVKRNSVYFGLGFRYGGGQTTYDGGLQDAAGNSLGPAQGKTDNQFLNVEGRLGYTFAPDRQKRLLISPFVALGYHQWNRDISGDLSTPSGPVQVLDTLEVYSWGYVGPGFHAEYKVSPKFDIGLNAKLMFMFGGRISLENSFQGILFNDGRGDLGNTLQYEIELPLTYHLIENPRTAIDLKLTPFFRSQDISRGQVFALSNGGGALEPASTTFVFGATVGVQFRF
jgi:Outer membrane protein beta-barrel domain